MKKIIIVGVNEYAQMIRYYVENENLSPCVVSGYAIEKQYIDNDYSNLDLPVYALEDLLHESEKEKYCFLLAIGYSDMNRIRERLMCKILNAGFQILSYIHPTAVVSQKSIIGIGNIIFENVLIQPFVKIGDGNVIQASSNIMHHTSIGNYNFMAANTTINGQVEIGNNNFIGSGAVIRNRVSLSNYCLVGAGAYIDKDIADNSVIVPSRSVKLDKSSFDIKI